MQIRKATREDIPALQSLYRDTVTTVNAADYLPDQIRAWVKTAERTDSLAARIASQWFYVAVTDAGEVVGFASFEEPDYLDMLYVHRLFQRQGIAKFLLEKIVEKAMETGALRIVSDVSITAKPFFIKQGFQVVREQCAVIDGISLVNFKMLMTREQFLDRYVYRLPTVTH